MLMCDSTAFYVLQLANKSSQSTEQIPESRRTFCQHPCILPRPPVCCTATHEIKTVSPHYQMQHIEVRKATFFLGGAQHSMMSFLNERLLLSTSSANRDHKWHFLISKLFIFPFSPPKRLQDLMYLHYMSGSTEVSKVEICQSILRIPLFELEFKQ